MSKKLIFAGAAALSLAAAPQAAHAITIATTTEANGNLPGYTTASVFQPFNDAPGVVSGPLPTISFNGTNVAQSYTGTNRIMSGSVFGQGSKPVLAGGNTFGNYLSIGAGILATGSYKLAFTGAPVHFLSFILGSIDASNQVRLTLGDNTVVNLLGAQIRTGNDQFSLANPIIPVGNGSTRVSYNFTGSDLKSIEFLNNTALPMEIDEIALAAPEPATWAMMLLGFGLVGSQLRRRSRKPARALVSA